MALERLLYTLMFRLAAGGLEHVVGGALSHRDVWPGCILLPILPANPVLYAFLR